MPERFEDEVPHSQKPSRTREEMSEIVARLRDKSLSHQTEMHAAQEQKSVARGKSDDWEIYTLRDAYAPKPPLQYLVADLFPLPSLSIVYGAPGTFKSFLLADMAVCVAAGMPWLSRKILQAPILWIDLDNGSRRTHERFEALARARVLREDIPLNYVSMPTPWLDAGNLREIEKLMARIVDRNIKLVCIDNLGLISPNADENSGEMIQIMGNLRLVVERTGVAAIVIHHQRKSGGTGTRAGESLRGHSSIEGAIDLALLVERIPGTSVVTLQTTKARDMDVRPFGAEFIYAHKSDTNQLAEASFRCVETMATSADGDIVEAIVSALSVSPVLAQCELIDQVKAKGIKDGKHSIRAVASIMIKRGTLLEKNGPKNSKLYSLAEPASFPFSPYKGGENGKQG